MKFSTTMFKPLVLIVMLYLLAGWSWAQDADAPVTPTATEASEPNLEADAENEADESDPDRFIPTEQVSQDLGVSFPVDI